MTNSKEVFANDEEICLLSNLTFDWSAKMLDQKMNVSDPSID